MDRFGLGERVRYKDDCPGEGFINYYTIPKGSCATVIQVLEGNRDCYMVRLDTPVPNYSPEHCVQGFDLEPE